MVILLVLAIGKCTLRTEVIMTCVPGVSGFINKMCTINLFS